MGGLYVPPPPTVAKTQLLIDLLTVLGWDATQETGFPLLPGPEVQATPDKEVTLTPSGGPGYVTEEASHDSWTFQARLRGGANDPLGAELAAQQLDQLILTAGKQSVDGVTVSSIARLGSPPSPLPLDPADRRTEFTCTYIVTTGSG